jgi:hypothetical protein
VAELEQKVQEENSMKFSLEVQINKMRYELQVINISDFLIIRNLLFR